MKNDEIKGNPFSVGQKVVCIDGNFRPSHNVDPKNGQIVTIIEIDGVFLTFLEIENIFIGNEEFIPEYIYTKFAPIQDATEMQEDETCEKVAKETEAEYAKRKEQKIEVVV